MEAGEDDQGEEGRKSESWIMIISEQHRYQGLSYKSDITVISGNILHRVPKECSVEDSSELLTNVKVKV